MAFDSLAPTYDQDFTASRVARYLRGRVHARLSRHFHAGDHVLELGCGTGEDALYLASQGIHVTATDARQMLEMARAKRREIRWCGWKAGLLTYPLSPPSPKSGGQAREGEFGQYSPFTAPLLKPVC
jgi:ubiquinone/menaquinone biosynthesis C-methylase UbiE